MTGISVCELTSSAIVTGRALFLNNPSSVLFVTSQLRPRELKMADGLRRIGWKVGLIYLKWTPFDPSDYFDFSLEIRSADEAHRCAKALSPRVCHVFSGAIDDLTLLFCRDKPAPVVIDLNDVFAPSLFDYCHERFEPTREALARADGFCARDLQVKRAERIDGFTLPRRVMLFPEYCWNTRPVREKPAQDIEEVHVVSVGTFSLETQGMFDSCYLQLARLFVAQDIHFHIYPHWCYRRDHDGSPHVNFERDFADFLDIERSSPYLHVHESLPIEQLSEVLPQYDFGIVSGGCAEFAQFLKFYKPAYLETCYSGRISDYLDAHLPVLINDEVSFDFWLLKRSGIGVDLKGILQPGFKEQLLTLKRDSEQRKSIGKAVTKLSIAANIPRLAKFYLEIIDAGAANNTYVGSANTVDLSFSPKEQEIIGSGLSFVRRLTAKIGIPQKFVRKIAKVLLPYREIRLLEGAAHNSKLQHLAAQQENAALHFRLDRLEKSTPIFETRAKRLKKTNAALRSQIERLERSQDRLSLRANGGGETICSPSLVTEADQIDASLQSKVARLEQELRTLSQQNHVLSNEKFILQQESRWGKMSINEIAGVLNWPQVLNDVDRSNGFAELVRMAGLFAASQHTTDRSSSCWDLLATKNYDQLLTSGYDNFKRTIGHNYFNFLVQKGDSQIQALESLLSPEVKARCQELACSSPDDPAFHWHDQTSYKYFVMLLWEYVKTLDTKGYLERIKEPREGNPILVSAEGQSISQDLANSLIEYYSISEAVPFESTKTVLEIGGGYGRNAHVILAANPQVKVTMVDIPPALFVAQRYLASVFKERRVFRVREFSRYEDVKSEMDESSIVFLMPHQLSLLPDNAFDLSLNISSFGEMRIDQIQWYFDQLNRLTRQHFFMKQWRTSSNVFDGTVLSEADYPYPKDWRKIYSRSCKVQTEFFEALYSVDKS